jgi:DNA-binding GntR family transcriptional regulator
MTTSTAVSERLRAEIQRGELVPGTHLRQGEVAKRLGVSTTPVREAFRILQAEGLLTMDPHRGAIVFRPTRSDLQEAFDIRIALEQLALSRAIPQMPEAAFSELEGIISRMKATEDPGRWRQLNTRFHSRIYSYSGLPRLRSMIANLTDTTSGYSQMATLRAPRSWWADQEHEAILEACKARDVRKAQTLLRDHLRLTVNFVLKLLDEQDSDQTRLGRRRSGGSSG